jgi:hypothetical protein
MRSVLGGPVIKEKKRKKKKRFSILSWYGKQFPVCRDGKGALEGWV